MAKRNPTPTGQDETRSQPASSPAAMDQFEMTSDDAWAVAVCVRKSDACWDRDSDPLGCPVTPDDAD